MNKRTINHNHFSLYRTELDIVTNKIEDFLKKSTDTDEFKISILKDTQDMYKKLSFKHKIKIFNKENIPIKNKNKNVIFTSEYFIDSIEKSELNDFIFFNPFELTNKYISKTDWVKIYIEDTSLEKIINKISKKKQLKGIGLLLPKNYNIGAFLSFIKPTNVNIVKLSKFYFVIINLYDHK
jgi:hypothetical protein